MVKTTSNLSKDTVAMSSTGSSSPNTANSKGMAVRLSTDNSSPSTVNPSMGSSKDTAARRNTDSKVLRHRAASNST